MSLYIPEKLHSAVIRETVFSWIGEKAETVRKQLGLEDKVVYAYMPTWRGTSNHSVNQDVLQQRSYQTDELFR